MVHFDGMGIFDLDVKFIKKQYQFNDKKSIIKTNNRIKCLRGRVKFPIGGKVRERKTHDLV